MIPDLEHSKPETRNERRCESRRRMLKHVLVLSLDKKAASAVDCTLRNVSSSGARLSGPLDCLKRIPSPFYLVVPGHLRMIRCKVVWRSHEAVGIGFLSDPGYISWAGSGVADRKPEETGPREPLRSLSPPDAYILDRATGAVVKLNVPDTTAWPTRMVHEDEGAM
jgi:hypothetical protein